MKTAAFEHMFRFIIKAVKVREGTLYTAHVSKCYRSESSAISGSFIYNPIRALCSRGAADLSVFLYLNDFILLAWLGVETFLLNTV